MEGSDGLFQLTCQCDNVYAPELGKCPACDLGTPHQKAMNFDYNKFFERIIGFQDQGKKADALDVLFDVFWQLHSRFDVMDKICSDIPVNRITGTLIVGVMSNCFKYKHKLPNFVDFCNRSAARLRELGMAENEISHYMRDFRDVDIKKHWGDMAALGAPNGLFGVGPGDLNDLGEEDESN